LLGDEFVISNTLENPTWKNTTVVPGEVEAVQQMVEAVQQMKDSGDGQIFMTGSATTVRWLLANNLLDELRLLLHPVVVGSGQKLFADGPATASSSSSSRPWSTRWPSMKRSLCRPWLRTTWAASRADPS
jgi:dihydrofolate reductase